MYYKQAVRRRNCSLSAPHTLLHFSPATLLLKIVRAAAAAAAASVRQRTGSTINSNRRRRTDRLKQTESDEMEGTKKPFSVPHRTQGGV